MSGFLGCGALFDPSGSSLSLPGLLKVVKFFSSLLGFTVSANDTLVGDFLGLRIGLLVGQLLGKLEGLKTEAGELDGSSRGKVDGLPLGEMDGPLNGTLVGERDGSVLGKLDGPS